MRAERRSRRTLLKALGMGSIATLAGCIGSSDDDESTSTEDEDDDESDTDDESDATALEEQLERVREATAEYSDPEVALEDGFEISGPYVPGMGWHFIHPERNEREEIDVEEPPMLTYLETDDGLELAAVEYGVPQAATDEPPSLFDDADADATEEWHGHDAATHVFAVPDGEATPLEEIPFEKWVTNDHWTEFHPPDEELERGDAVSLNWGSADGNEGDGEERVVDLVTNHPALHTLHVWVHMDNPDGVFAPVHPDYVEGDDGHEHDHDHEDDGDHEH